MTIHILLSIKSYSYGLLTQKTFLPREPRKGNSCAELVRRTCARRTFAQNSCAELVRGIRAEFLVHIRTRTENSRAELMRATRALNSRAELAGKIRTQISWAELVRRISAKTSRAARGNSARRAKQTRAQNSRAELIRGAHAQNSCIEFARRTRARNSCVELVRRTRVCGAQLPAEHAQAARDRAVVISAPRTVCSESNA